VANVTGQAYGLTVLSPIRTDLVGYVSRARILRGYLAGLPVGAESPFARVPMMHFARWVVLDTLPFEGYPSTDDMLASAYLLFVCEFDGDLPEMLNMLASSIGDVVSDVYAHCVDFPGTHSLRAFQMYMTSCQIDTTFLYSSYPNDSVDDVLKALLLQRELGTWLADNQGLLHAQVAGSADAAELQVAFRTFGRHMDALPLPPRGAA
jgi:hypothetical protein